jgi:hypothetical protein
MDLTLQFHDASGLVAQVMIAAHNKGQLVLSHHAKGFVMAELRDARGSLHAVTNPIYIA